MNATPLLEDLRHFAAPTWLWDAGRARVVWANAAGIAAFDCDTLFDLIDRPFDTQEPGVAAIVDLGKQLRAGAGEDVSLLLPSSGRAEPYVGKAYLHPLADGRPGVLVVVNLPKAIEVAVEDVPAVAASESALLSALPHGAAICDAGFRIIAANPHLTSDFSRDAAGTLATLLGSEERANRLQGKLQNNAVASSIETISSLHGIREFKLTLSRLAAGQDGQTLLLLEDVTERRKLERQLSEVTEIVAAKDVPVKSVLTSPEQVFAEIGRQLSNSLASEKRDVPAVDTPAPKPAPVVATRSEAGVIPEAVRMALEQAGSGIAICQQGKPVYITQKALEVLALPSRDAAMADVALWDALKDIKPGGQHTIKAAGGAQVTVSMMPMPWQNGRAEQFSFRPFVPPSVEKPLRVSTELKALETEKPVLVAEATPSAVKPEPKIEQISGHDSALHDELKAILDVVSDGIITLNAAGEILSFSAGAEAIFETRQGEAVGRPLADFLTLDSRKILRDYLKSLSSTGLGTVFNDGREMMALHQKGGPSPLFVSVSRLQAPRSKAMFCVLVRDITPWKKTESELIAAREHAEQANRRKSDFIAHISHELRTPLNAILGFSDVMRGERLGPFGNAKYLAYANDIHTSGSHLLAIINDLLDLSKVEAGKLELNFVAVNLEETADYVLRMTREDAAAASVIVRRAIPKNLPRVVGDIKSLRQVLLNLVSNAIKFTNAGGEVLISGSFEADGTLALRVKDTGVGMTAVELEAALQPFGRVEDADRPRPGTGLGLPLTKSLVEANRAKLTLQSDPGHGTLAEIVFPGPRVLAE